MPELGNEPPGQSASPCCSRLDFVLVTLVLAFAFLSASFVARNSDIWLHLATGRLIASGEYHFGSDPFAYTTADRYWANHSWFFDLGLYVAYGTLGGAGLVALKAIGVGIVAGLMLLTTRGRSPVWIAAACVMVGVLAMTPRLLLQPTVASYLLLAACLFCLHAGGRALALVPALIVLWVNVDVWFILGPLLVLCFGIGRLMDRDRASLPRWPWWVIPASFAASLVSPHHVFALVLPMELSPAVWRSAFAVDPRFAGLFTSPWRWGSLGGSGGYNLACWAFFLLLGAGAASFVIDPRAVRSWRLMVWLPFALLAAWQERLIPFFAIVAGPITALNLGEGLARSRCARCGRNTVLTASAVLSVLAWFGWTNGFGRSDRRPGWGIFVNPSLQRAAHGVAVWRQSLAAPNEGRIFETHPDLSHYIAWFRPGERVFLDLRLDLFTNVAADYAALLRGVGLFPSNGSNEWEEVARRYRLNAILLHEPDFNRLSRTLGGIENWEVARVDGAEVLYVPKGSPGPRFDSERSAFGSASELRPAGERGAVLATPSPWWERLRDRGALGSWEAAGARVYLQLLAGPRSSSPALALLAIHSARLGTEVDPRDPAAWLMLAIAYESLGERTWESDAGARLTLLVEVRLVQLTTALVQAVLRDPDSSLAHQRLARIFDRRHVIDLAYSHTRESLRLLKRSGRAPGESEEMFQERIARLTDLVARFEAQVQDAENRYLIRTAGLASKPLARARIAAELGLFQKAVDVLLQSHPDLYGNQGVAELAEWLLQLGRAAECRVLLDGLSEGKRAALGEMQQAGAPHPNGHRWSYHLQAFDWLDLRLCAAAGDYRGAAKAIDRLAERLRYQEEQPVPNGTSEMLRTETALHIASEVMLGAAPASIAGRVTQGSFRQRMTDFLAHTSFLAVARGDLLTLAGVLQLERGDATAADRRFEDARALYYRMKSVAPSLPGEPLATRYHEAILKSR